MKRFAEYSQQPMRTKQGSIESWIKYLILVLAFIGLWQTLANGLMVLDRWM